MATEPVQIVQQDGEIHLLFNTVLSVVQARELHAQLGQVLTRSMALVLDAGRVEQVDAAAMQVLASFCRQSRAQSLTMRWRAVSLPVQQASQLLGLDSLLGDLA
jgi:anti-anti-sigma regulatory factor